MGETPREIEAEIEQARNRLGQDLNELEYRVKSELDWRTQFNRRPWAFLAAAFGISLLIGWIVAPSGDES
jgi:hypothetical protein